MASRPLAVKALTVEDFRPPRSGPTYREVLEEIARTPGPELPSDSPSTTQQWAWLDAIKKHEVPSDFVDRVTLGLVQGHAGGERMTASVMAKCIVWVYRQPRKSE